MLCTFMFPLHTKKVISKKKKIRINEIKDREGAECMIKMIEKKKVLNFKTRMQKFDIGLYSKET